MHLLEKKETVKSVVLNLKKAKINLIIVTWRNSSVSS